MKIAILGFGYWGEKLLKSLLSIKMKNDSLWVVDIDKKKQEKAKKYGVKFSTDIKLVYSKVDAFIIATWENTHYELTKKCLLNKKHVLVEKPLSFTYNQAKELVKIAEKNKLTLMVDNTFLYDKSFLLIKKEVEKGKIGILKQINSFRCSTNIIKPFTNVIFDLFPHDISIFYSLLRPKLSPMRINLHCWKLKNKNYDNAWITLNFNSVVINSFLSWTYPLNKREMVFYGSQGSILWRKKTDNSDDIIFFKYIKGKTREIKKIEVDKKKETLKNVLKEFIKCILNKKEPKTSGKKVLPEIKILEDIYKKTQN